MSLASHATAISAIIGQLAHFNFIGKAKPSLKSLNVFQEKKLNGRFLPLDPRRLHALSGPKHA